MLDRSVHVIHQVRAARATLFPIRTKHEVIRGELATSVEQIRQAQFALWACEDIVLRDLGPGKFATLASERVAQVRQLLFLGQEFATSAQPFAFGNNLVIERDCGIHEESSCK